VEFDAVVVALPAAPSCSLDTVPAAPLVLVQSELLLGETERWMLPPHAWPRIFLREKDGTGPVLAAVRRLVPEPSRGEK
jgi:hypothetical protein